MDIVSEVTGMPITEIKSKKKYDAIVKARHLFMYVAYVLKLGTDRAIGWFLKVDRSTVTDGRKTAKDLIMCNEQLFVPYLNQIMEACLERIGVAALPEPSK